MRNSPGSVAMAACSEGGTVSGRARALNASTPAHSSRAPTVAATVASAVSSWPKPPRLLPPTLLPRPWAGATIDVAPCTATIREERPDRNQYDVHHRMHAPPGPHRLRLAPDGKCISRDFVALHPSATKPRTSGSARIGRAACSPPRVIALALDGVAYFRPRKWLTYLNDMSVS
ncbi:hypothetical protein ACJJTC_013431 [Scirpophaga incertulas]